ncbi:MAG: Lrp/AsnC family transcriptional regulator [Clostridia bacterium]|nr:Lrp/AsnC family transcriptional regulator [Clostridia bacterium]
MIDQKILKLLAHNADIPTVEISMAVNLSIPAVNKRILKLKESGVIRSNTILTDQKKVGKPIIAYILLTLQYGSAVESLMACIEKDPDILECYAVTGDYDYIIKICASDMEHLEDKLLLLKGQKGVMKSHTMLSLMEHKFSPTALPDVDGQKG